MANEAINNFDDKWNFHMTVRVLGALDDQLLLVTFVCFKPCADFNSIVYVIRLRWGCPLWPSLSRCISPRWLAARLFVSTVSLLDATSPDIACECRTTGSQCVLCVMSFRWRLPPPVVVRSRWYLGVLCLSYCRRSVSACIVRYLTSKCLMFDAHSSTNLR